MNDCVFLTSAAIEDFCAELRRRERSPGTIAQYRRALEHLLAFLPRERPLDREPLLRWKEHLAQRRAIRTVNAMIAGANAFLEFVGAGHLRLKSLRYQRQTFSEDELSREEFQSLISQARRDRDRQGLALLRAMAGLGLRVGEMGCLTVEALRAGVAVVRSKGKTRRVPLGEHLCRQLREFARQAGISSGPIFLSRRGLPLDRRRIWEKLKKLCAGAGVDPEKVHPHALRHLFARMFYDMTRDIAKLADLLGHGSVETTRIYIMTSCHEHRAILDRLSDRLEAGQRTPFFYNGG